MYNSFMQQISCNQPTGVFKMFKSLQTIVKVTALTAVALSISAAQADTLVRNYTTDFRFSRVYEERLGREDSDTTVDKKAVWYGNHEKKGSAYLGSNYYTKEPATTNQVPDTSFSHVITMTERKPDQDHMVLNFSFTSTGMGKTLEFKNGELKAITYPEGLWTRNPNAIFAVMLRASSTGVNNTGAGMLIGNLSGISWSEGGACQGAINTQPAYWYTNEKAQDFGKYWGGSQCGKPLKDNQQYDVSMTVTKNTIQYTVTDNTTKEKMTEVFQDNKDQPGEIMLSKSTGATFAVVFADNEKDDFQFHVNDIKISWY